MNAVLEALNISFSYRDSCEKSSVLDSFDYRLGEGEFAAIIGPGGAGKSTLMNLFSGFLKPRAGRILLKGENLAFINPSARARQIAAVPQGSSIPLPYTVREIVEMGRYCRLGKFSSLGPSDMTAVEHAMAAMNVVHYASRLFGSLSGGEKQRVMIAAALAQETDILLLDEPNSALDLGAACKLMTLLTSLNRERGISILMVTHDIQLAAAFARRISVLNQGRIIADGPSSQVISEALLRDVYDCPAEIISHKGCPLISLPAP